MVDYYNKVIETYKQSRYTIKSIKGSNSQHTENPVFKIKLINIYAVDYIIWVYNGHNKQTQSIFDFIVVPSDLELFDFTGYSFEDIYGFLITIKN